MQRTVNIPYEQLIGIIKGLPASLQARIKSDLDDSMVTPKSETEKTDFQKFLLEAPVMSSSQYKQFKENRKLFYRWRSK